MRMSPSVILLTWACLVAPGVAPGQGVVGIASPSQGAPPQSADSSAADMPSPRRPEDERALRILAEAYARSYTAGDARALASLFTDDAELVEEHGGRLRGRPAIENLFQAAFRRKSGATLTITPITLRFIRPDVAQEEGQIAIRIGDETPSVRRYTVIAVKEGDRWRYSSLRDAPEPNLTPHQRLEELAWLVGDWTDESPDSVVQVSCRWTPDGHFLLRDFTIQVQGKSVMSVNERIGWDPSTRQIKSWVFDSEGGHGTGVWSRAGNEWIIKSTGVMPDGRTATATHTLTRLGPQSARWSSVERTVGDRIVPDQAEYLMVRRPPPPRGRQAGSNP